jgi:hypothetical protein
LQLQIHPHARKKTRKKMRGRRAVPAEQAWPFQESESTLSYMEGWKRRKKDCWESLSSILIYYMGLTTLLGKQHWIVVTKERLLVLLATHLKAGAVRK